MKLLITGAAGQLGRALTRRAHAAHVVAGYDVVAGASYGCPSGRPQPENATG
jgi:uncharacterized protein YbjT (DUF2867 family)